jgi:hypothetical protein
MNAREEDDDIATCQPVCDGLNSPAMGKAESLASLGETLVQEFKIFIEQRRHSQKSYTWTSRAYGERTRGEIHSAEMIGGMVEIK